MKIKTRILLAVFTIELLGYGILLFHSNSQSTETLINVREKQIQATILDNFNKINYLTNSMERKAIEIAQAGQLLYNIKNQTEFPQKDQWFENYLKDSFEIFPESIGGGLWYEPYIIDKNEQFYGPYVFWNNDQVEFTWDLNTQEYNYLEQDWYLTGLPKNWKRDQRLPELVYWTEPYWDEAGSRELMMTVDAIMYTPNNHILGISTVDWSLKEMTEFISKISITENTQTFLVDTLSNKVLSNEIDPLTKMLDYTSVDWMKELQIHDLETGQINDVKDVVVNHIHYKLYYLKSDSGLVLGVLIPENELYLEVEKSTRQLMTSGVVIIVVFILLMLFLLELLFRPFQKVRELISKSLTQNSKGQLEVKKVEYNKQNEFTPIIEALNLTYEQINKYTNEVEQADKAKTTFLTTMSHEIRTPMNGILGYTQLLALDESIPDKHKEALSAIESSGNHLLSLLNDVLDISKIESGAMVLHNEDVCLDSLFDEIDSLFKLRCKMEGIEWKFESNVPDNLILNIDGSKIKQIIINLLGNSIKFTNKGFISLKATIRSNELHLLMSDTGVGIKKEHQSELFTPFFQSNAGIEYGGTGLGLTIVSKLVDLLDGKINLINSDESGTSFEVIIPAENMEFNALKNKTKLNKKLNTLKFSDKNLKALIVDDVKFNRDILVNVLSHMKVSSKEAIDGKDALTKLKDFHPDVIFIDIQMPVMDGKDLMQKIIVQYPQYIGKCIAISANVYDDDSKYLAYGFSYSLSKPFKITDVEVILTKMMDQ
ncbi:ATP-binding protein [Marinicellulosiphila megalodicopiae]|uniref:ATP-binding protein n=1 Tax=Marinicellulosiphila megalodicopiae TaxID=2724896 RepID=UPI003BB19DF8